MVTIRFVVFTLLSLITVSCSKKITDDDIDLIIFKFKEWGGLAPKIDVVIEGTVTGGKKDRSYNFKFMAEDGVRCTGMIYMNTAGKGRHRWNCRGKAWKAKSGSGNNTIGMKRRSRGKNNGGKVSKSKTNGKTRKYKRKGSVTNFVHHKQG